MQRTPLAPRPVLMADPLVADSLVADQLMADVLMADVVMADPVPAPRRRAASPLRVARSPLREPASPPSTSLTSPRVTHLRLNISALRVPPMRLDIRNLLTRQLSSLRLDRSSLQSTFVENVDAPRVSPVRHGRVPNQDSFEVLNAPAEDEEEADVTIVHGDDTWSLFQVK